jgi:serine/threonine protein kinase
MPDRSACDEAMRFAKSRLKVQDHDLLNGEVETITAGLLSIPWGLQGGFAVVYKFRTQSGKMRALRCYLVPMKADTQYRYERIGAYFAQHLPDITAQFKYHNDGILIKETEPGKPATKKPYALIEMEWIDGYTLIDHVALLCQRRDHTGLTKTVEQWVKIIQALRQAKVAHCDLAGGNVMVRKDGRLVLVDYDGVYIPDFLGQPGIVEGQVDYQHPDMSGRPFNEHADTFSAMVIYTALLALSIKPDLWNAYASQNTLIQGSAQETNLLFKRQDFIDPFASPLFTDLQQINDNRLNKVLADLKHACRLTITQVQLSPLVCDPEFAQKEALTKLEQAINQTNEETIVLTWQASQLDTYQPAQKYRADYIRAKQRMGKLEHFRQAIQSGSIQKIIDDYDPELDQLSSVKSQERILLRFALKLQEAYNNQDEDALITVWNEVESLNQASSFTLTPQEKQSLQLAQRRKTCLTNFKQALANKRVREIANAYDPILDYSTQISTQERDILKLAKKFINIYQSDNDQNIQDIYETIQRSPLNNHLSFTIQEIQRVTLAQQRITALETFRLALTTKNIQDILAAYDPILDASKEITSHERELLRRARDFAQAYNNDDDQTLIASHHNITQSYQQHLTFTVQEEQRVTLTDQRMAALVIFRQALASRQATQIVATYDQILNNCKSVTNTERERLALATDLVQALNSDDDQAVIDSWQDIQSSRYQPQFVLTPLEEHRFVLAQKRLFALESFQRFLSIPGKKEAASIITIYDPILDGHPSVTSEQRYLIQAAQYFLHMRSAILKAIENNSDEEISSVYNAAVAQQFADFTPQQYARINTALKRGQLEKALQGNDYGTAIRVAEEIEIESHQQITDLRLASAKRYFIQRFEVRDVAAWRQNDEVIVQWSWPQESLVRHAVILWRLDRSPQNPRREELGTTRQVVFREHQEPHALVRFPAPEYMAVHLQVYFAIPDYRQVPPTWFYSHGTEQGSRAKAYYSGPNYRAI